MFMHITFCFDRLLSPRHCLLCFWVLHTLCDYIVCSGCDTCHMQDQCSCCRHSWPSSTRPGRHALCAAHATAAKSLSTCAASNHTQCRDSRRCSLQHAVHAEPPSRQPVPAAKKLTTAQLPHTHKSSTKSAGSTDAGLSAMRCSPAIVSRGGQAAAGALAQHRE